ncbi:hypothetical protein TNCV_3242211 [Trichonephila clavipes]|nr:hypothetical protein TNCV_3242211 [Trichonephila clavipes]
MMSRDISFQICCNPASTSFKLVGCPIDSRYARLEINLEIGQTKEVCNSAETVLRYFGRVRSSIVLLKNGSWEPLHKWQHMWLK